MMIEYYIYTDGSCFPNPGIGAWAYVILRSNTTGHIFGILHDQSGTNLDTTNNRMELQAIIEALEALPKGDPKSDVIIYSDSLYAINFITYKSQINKDLRPRLVNALKDHNVRFGHVYGHTGNYWNEYVDKRAYITLANKYKELGISMTKSAIKPKKYTNKNIYLKIKELNNKYSSKKT